MYAKSSVSGGVARNGLKILAIDAPGVYAVRQSKEREFPRVSNSEQGSTLCKHREEEKIPALSLSSHLPTTLLPFDHGRGGYETQ